MTDNTHKVNDEDVMISTSMKDLEALYENVDKHQEKKWEKYFIPALGVFTLIVVLAYLIVYSITQDMTKLATSMDPNMGSNMSQMTKSIQELSLSVQEMTSTVKRMDKNFASVASDMKLFKPMLVNMEEMNNNMKDIAISVRIMKPMNQSMTQMTGHIQNMEKSMIYMQRDISQLRGDFSKPMSVFNAVPFL
jgi:ABC-type multidrug transport system fused ATPase/permease subunit